MNVGTLLHYKLHVNADQEVSTGFRSWSLRAQSAQLSAEWSKSHRHRLVRHLTIIDPKQLANPVTFLYSNWWETGSSTQLTLCGLGTDTVSENPHLSSHSTHHVYINYVYGMYRQVHSACHVRIRDFRITRQAFGLWDLESSRCTLPWQWDLYIRNSAQM